MIEVYRIRDSIARTPRFAERVFTPDERAYCESKGKAADQSFAARFAAKEALFKALRTGWRGKLKWQDVEVVNDDHGAPSFKLTGEAERLMKEGGVKRIHLSISHTADQAIAQVILEG